MFKCDLNLIKNELSILNDFCRICKGRCCSIRHTLIISKDEYKNLKWLISLKPETINSPYGNAYSIRPHGYKCSILNRDGGDTGCLLDINTRPLVCLLFPIVFVMHRRELKFYYSSFCPYISKIAKLVNWKKVIIERAKNQIELYWTYSELLCHGYYFNKTNMIK